MKGRHGRQRSLYLIAVLVGAVIAVVAFIATGRSDGAPSTRPTGASPVGLTTQAPRSTTPSAHRAGALLPLPNGPTGPAHDAPTTTAASPPAHLTIASIGVDSDLEFLGLRPDRTLQPPTAWDEAGWYAGGVHPGNPGPAVIVGHVDSVSGPAVFFRLKQLAPGAAVLVRQANGRTLTFIVDDLREYPKNSFPTEAVYGPTSLPELRLITCTGDFDRAARSYVDNLVVSAHLTA